MRIAYGELRDARDNPHLVGHQVGDGFYLTRDVSSERLAALTNSLTPQFESLRGNLSFRRNRQVFIRGLRILGSRTLKHTLEAEDRGAEWESIQSRSMRTELLHMNKVAQRKRLPNFVPARATAFYFERPEYSTDAEQYIRCRLGERGANDPQKLQQQERALFIRELLGVSVESLEQPQDDDGILNYATFPSQTDESAVRGIVATLNGHIEETGISVNIKTLSYRVFAGSSEG